MNYIVDDIGRIVQNMRTGGGYEAHYEDAYESLGPPYYMYGHRLEIANRLRDMNQDASFKYTKYPLVALRMDIAEDVKNYFYSYQLNIAILASTQLGYNAKDRYLNVFKPILYPLYQQFMDGLRKCGLFQWGVPGQIDQGAYPPHTKIDRPFWGTGYGNGKPPANEGNQKFLFDDPLDAIEIVNLQIKSLYRC